VSGPSGLEIVQLPLGAYQANCYLVAREGGSEAAVIDPGDMPDAVLGQLAERGWTAAGVLVTHGHIDHVAGCAEAARRLSAPMQVHADDREWIASLPQQAEMFGFEGGGERPAVDHHHRDGETIAVGGHVGRVLHTPGHSRGSCCLFFESDRTLFAGDTLFAGSVGRTDLPGGDFDALEHSIRQKLFPLGDDVRFFPGHGPSGSLGDERRGNPFVGETPPRGRFL
jgi:glyoxylase-like metal-dependent hydrolase (beta-lactamase superfamily II)